MLWWYSKDTKCVEGAEENLRCCGGYRGWLRTTKVALVATGQAECCGSYRGRLKNTMVLFWLQKQAVNH